MYNYLIANNLIYEKQAGFLTGHSTVFQLIDLYHQIAQSFDSKTHTCVIFCDISKAFDRVWHKGLLFKLQQLGIADQLLKWISNYLEDRQQRVLLACHIHDSKTSLLDYPRDQYLDRFCF